MKLGPASIILLLATSQVFGKQMYVECMLSKGKVTHAVLPPKLAIYFIENSQDSANCSLRTATQAEISKEDKECNERIKADSFSKGLSVQEIHQLIIQRQAIMNDPNQQ